MSSPAAMGANLFSSPPPKPGNGMNDPHAPKPPPFPTITRKRIPKPNKPALKSPHSRTKYHKPVPDSGVVSVSGDRSVVVGESGVSYLLPGAPFEFQFSYSETPKVKPLAFREPAFLPFAPPTMPRPWTGKAPLKSKKEKELKRQKKVRLLQPFGQESSDKLHLEMAKKVELGQYHKRSREEILGEPLTKAEVQALLKLCIRRNRQVNLGRDGLTHNMLELIHSHWRRDEICKVRCRGVPTVDMDNVCYHLQEKTGGKIIYRVGGIVYLFRGRHYDPRTRPRYPIMLWKPATPVYPKLIQEAPEGLTKLEADDMRSKGRKLLPICKLAKNGIYLTLVKDVRDAFEGSPLVKINCQGLDASDYKRIGAKLKDLVPCVLLSFDEESILMWRGKDWKSRYLKPIAKLKTCDESKSTKERPPKKKDVPSPRMMQLWNKAIESKRAILLDESPLSPDALLEKVEEFEGISQALEHSYKALILSNDEGTNASEESEDISDTEIIDNIQNENDYSIGSDSDCFDEFNSTIPYGLMPVDAIAKDLTLDFE